MPEFNLENFLRAYVDFAEANRGWDFNSHRDMFDDVIDSIMKDQYDDEKKVRDRELYFSDFLQGLFDKIYYAKNDHQDMSEMMNIYKFITEQVFYPYQKDDNTFSGYKDKPYNNYGHLSVFMKKLKDMQDKNPDLVYRALALLKRSVNYKRPGDRDINAERLPLYRDIVTMMANNPNATVDDIKEMAYWVQTPEQMEKIINDVFAKVDESLVDIMSKDVPDAEKIRKQIIYPDGVILVAKAQGATKPSPEYLEWLSNMKQKDPQKYQAWQDKLNNYDKINNEKYNFDNVFNSGDQHYVSSYEDLVEKRNVDLEQQNGDLKNENVKLKEENKRLNQDNNALLQNAESDRAEIQGLKEEIEKLRQELANEKNAKTRAQDKVRRFSEAATAVEQAGAFKRGDALRALKRINDSANEI